MRTGQEVFRFREEDLHRGLAPILMRTCLVVHQNGSLNRVLRLLKVQLLAGDVPEFFEHIIHVFDQEVVRRFARLGYTDAIASLPKQIHDVY